MAESSQVWLKVLNYILRKISESEVYGKEKEIHGYINHSKMAE